MGGGAGTFLRKFGGVHGSGPGQINVAHNCAFADGKLVAHATANPRHLLHTLSR